MAAMTTANLVANVYANVSGFIAGLQKASEAAAEGAVAIDAAGLAAVDLTTAMSAAGTAAATNAAALAADAAAAAEVATALDVTAGSATALTTTLDAVDLAAGIASATLSAEAVAAAELAASFDLAAIAAEELALAEGVAAEAAVAGAAAQVSMGAAAVTTGKFITKAFAPMLLVGALAMKMSMDFGTAIGKIRRLTNNTTADVEKMRLAILKIAVASGKGPKELADAMFLLASSGLKADAAISALSMSAQASAIGLGDTATIADGVASAMNAYSKSHLSARDATNALINAVKVGKMPAEDLTKVLGTIIPVASNMGVSFQEVTADIASLTQVGVPATRAATGLRAILSGILSPTKDAEKAFKLAGYGVRELNDSVAKNGLLPTLQDLKAHTDGSTMAMQAMFPQTRALSAVLALTGGNAKNAAANFAELQQNTDTLAKGMADLASKPGFKMKQALEEMQVALIKLGDAFLPMAAKGATALGHLFSAVATIPKPILAIVAALSAWGIQAAIFITVMGKVYEGIMAVKTAMIALSTGAEATNWIVLVGVALAALTTAFMASAGGAKASKGDVDALTESYRTQKGVIDQTAAAYLYQTLVSKHQDDDLRRIQKSLGNNVNAWQLWTDAVKGSKSAAQQIRAALVESGDATIYFQKGTSKYKAAVADFIKTGNTDWTSGNIGILKTLAGQALASKDALMLLDTEAETGKIAFDAVANGVNSVGDNLQTMKTDMEDATKAGDDLKTAFDAIFGSTMSQVEAEIAARGAVQAMKDAFKDQKGTLDTHVTSLLGAVKGYDDLATATARVDPAKAQADWLANTQALVLAAKAAGAGQAEFVQLGRAMNLPETVVTAMSTPGADAAKILFENLPGILALIPKEVPVTVTADTSQAVIAVWGVKHDLDFLKSKAELASEALQHMWNVYWGTGTGAVGPVGPDGTPVDPSTLPGAPVVPPPKGNAAGGIFVQRKVGLIGEAGPEAVVPLGNSPAASKNRANVMAAAGLGNNTVGIPMSGGSAGTSNTYNVNVSVPATADPAKVGQAVVDSLVAWSRRNGAIPVSVSG